MNQIDTIRKGIHHKYTCASSFGYSCDCGACEALAALDQLEQAQQLTTKLVTKMYNAVTEYGDSLDDTLEADEIISWYESLPAPPKENDDD